MNLVVSHSETDRICVFFSSKFTRRVELLISLLEKSKIERPKTCFCVDMTVWSIQLIRKVKYQNIQYIQTQTILIKVIYSYCCQKYCNLFSMFSFQRATTHASQPFHVYKVKIFRAIKIFINIISRFFLSQFRTWKTVLGRCRNR